MALLLKGGRVLLPDGEKIADVRVDGGLIADIAENIPAQDGDDVLDCEGLLVLPGAVDAHVHYNMKTATGRTADDFESGSRSAALGGVTSFVDFAPPEEGMTLLESLRAREAEAAGNTYADYSFHMEITGNVPVEDYKYLPQLRSYGINSVKIYTTYGSDRLPPENLVPLMQACKQAGLIMMAHAEDDAVLKAADNMLRADGRLDPSEYPLSRPAAAEAEAVKDIIEAVRKTGCAVYIAHVSAAESVRLIASAQGEGLPVSGETCPHYLLLDERVYLASDSAKYIMAPPLRKKADCEALWQAIAEGVLSCVSTDHCAFRLADKLGVNEYPTVIPGIGGSELLLPLMYSEGVAKGRITLRRMVELISHNPAEIFGFSHRKGAIATGFDADIVVFDPSREWTVKGGELQSNAGYSVFDGWRLTGAVQASIVRGEVVCKSGCLMAHWPFGHMVTCR